MGTDGQTDRYDDANSRFSQFCKCASKSVQLRSDLFLKRQTTNQNIASLNKKASKLSALRQYSAKGQL